MQCTWRLRWRLGYSVCANCAMRLYFCGIKRVIGIIGIIPIWHEFPGRLGLHWKFVLLKPWLQPWLSWQKSAVEVAPSLLGFAESREDVRRTARGGQMGFLHGMAIGSMQLDCDGDEVSRWHSTQMLLNFPDHLDPLGMVREFKTRSGPGSSSDRPS